MAKVLVRNTTWKSVRSYDRPSDVTPVGMRPNPIGVVALASVNGRGAYRRAKAAQLRANMKVDHTRILVWRKGRAVSVPANSREAKRALAAEKRYVKGLDAKRSGRGSMKVDHTRILVWRKGRAVSVPANSREAKRALAAEKRYVKGLDASKRAAGSRSVAKRSATKTYRRAGHGKVYKHHEDHVAELSEFLHKAGFYPSYAAAKSRVVHSPHKPGAYLDYLDERAHDGLLTPREAKAYKAVFGRTVSSKAGSAATSWHDEEGSVGYDGYRPARSSGKKRPARKAAAGRTWGSPAEKFAAFLYQAGIESSMSAAREHVRHAAKKAGHPVSQHASVALEDLLSRFKGEKRALTGRQRGAFYNAVLKGAASGSKSSGATKRAAEKGKTPMAKKARKKKAATKKAAKRGTRRSRKTPTGKRRLSLRRVFSKKTGRTKYRRSRGGATAAGVAGSGTVFVKKGRQMKRAKFKSQVAVHLVGKGKTKRLAVFYKNRGKSRPFNAPPPAPGSVQYGTQEDRDIETLMAIADVNERMKAARRMFGKSYPYKFTQRKRTVVDHVPRVMGGFRIKTHKGRPVFGKGPGHIAMWQAVGAPSPLFYAKNRELYAAAEAEIKSLRASRAAALRKRAADAVAHANAVEEAGDMYTPNRHRGKKRRSRKSRKKSWYRTAARRRASKRTRKSGSQRRRSYGRKRHHGRKHAMRRRSGSKRMRRNRSGMKMLSNKRRRRAGKRRMRRNGFAAYMPTAQTAAVALGGFVGHRVLKGALNGFVMSQVSAVPDQYKGILSSLLSALIIVPVAAKVSPEHGLMVGAGAVVGLGLDVLGMLVSMVYPAASPYLAGLGAEVPMRNITGWSSYEPVSGYGVLPYAQAAAGLGIGYKAEAAKYGEMPMQAAAGYGVLPYAQAAAGYGVASYEPVSGAQVFDGIGADQASAEAALNAADMMATPVQAAAGYGDIPTQNIWIPGPEQDPSRAIGGFGGQGIFADPTLLAPRPHVRTRPGGPRKTAAPGLGR